MIVDQINIGNTTIFRRINGDLFVVCDCKSDNYSIGLPVGYSVNLHDKCDCGAHSVGSEIHSSWCSCNK